MQPIKIVDFYVKTLESIDFSWKHVILTIFFTPSGQEKPFLYSSLVSHVGRNFYIFIRIPSRRKEFSFLPSKIFNFTEFFRHVGRNFTLKIIPTYMMKSLVFWCLNYTGMPFLPNRVGRYKNPTPWVQNSSPCGFAAREGICTRGVGILYLPVRLGRKGPFKHQGLYKSKATI